MTPLAVPDGRTRWLVIVGFGAYRKESGLAPLRRLREEIETVRAVFRQLGYPDEHHRVWIDRDVADVRGEIYDLLASLGPDDVVALHVTGHGEVVDGKPGVRLFVHASTSSVGRLRDVLTVEELLRGLGEHPVDRQLGRMLLVIDVCNAAAGLTEAMDAVRTWLDGGAVGRTPVSVVATALDGGDAVTGAFARAFRTAIENDLTDRAEPYLDLSRILGRVRALLPRQPLDDLAWRVEGDDPALPNPRHYVVGVDWADLRDWWEPRARAAHDQVAPRGSAAGPDRAWYFTGRKAVTEHLARWADDPDGAPVVVITAAPGSGKSSVLARLVALTVPDVRRDWAAHAGLGEDAGAPGPSFRFAASIWARQLAVAGARQRVLAALGVDADTDLGQLPPCADGRPVLAVDEAEEPARLVRDLLAPLARSASRGALRLIVATRTAPVGYERSGSARRSMDLRGPLLVPGHELVELDKPRWLRQGDISQYAEMLLAAATPGSRPNPWRDAPAERAELAREIERRSRGSFLLAGLVARRHTHDRVRTDPKSPAWQAQFPEDIGIALKDELEAASGFVEARRLRALLRPLALAPGAGLARERVGPVDLWAALATVLSPDVGPFTGGDVDDLLGNRAATHLIASSDAAGTPTYRLHHQALVDHFAPRATARSDHHAVFDELRRLLLDADGRPDWLRGTRYHLRALPSHAAAASRLPDVTTDAEALVHLDPERLFAALRGHREPSSVTAVSLLAPRLRQLSTLGPHCRSVLLAQVATNGLANQQLAAALRALATAAGVTVLASAARSTARSIVLSDVPLGPTSVVAASAAGPGQPVVVVAEGRTVDLWDPDDLTLLATLGDTHHADPVVDLLAFGDGATGALLATIDAAGRVRVRDLTMTGGAGARAAVPGAVPRIAAGCSARGVPLLAVSTTGGVMVLRPDTGEQVWSQPVTPGPDLVTAVTTVPRSADDDLLALAHRDRVRLVRVSDGEQVDELALPGAVSPSLAAGGIPGRDGVLLVLDAAVGLLIRWQPGEQMIPLTDDEVHPTCAVVHPSADGLLLAIIGGLRGDVELWDVLASARKRLLRHGGGTINDVEVLPAVAGQPALCSAVDRFGQLDVWRWDDGEWLTTHRPADEVHRVALGRHGDGEPFAATASRGGIRLWELSASAIQVAPDLHSGQISDLALVPEHHGAPALVTLGSESAIRLWDATTGELLSTRSCPPDTAARLLVRDDGSCLRAIWAGDVGIVDTALSGPASRLALRIGSVHAITPVGPDRLLIGLRDRAQLRHARSGELLAEMAARSGVVQFVAASSITDDAVLAAIGTDSGELTVWRWAPAEGAVPIVHDSGPPVQVLRIVAHDGGSATVVAGSRRGVLRTIRLQADGTWGRTAQSISEDAVVTGLYIDRAGGAVAAQRAGRGGDLARWCDGGKLERVHTRAPVRALTGPTRWRGRRTAVGITEEAVVLMALDGEFAVEEIPVSLTPEALAVHEDLVVVAGSGGFVSFRLRPD